MVSERTTAVINPSFIQIWGIELPTCGLSDFEIAYLQALPKELPSGEWGQIELDRVWNALGLDNRLPLSAQRTADYYRHPCWVMNGIFYAVDPTSKGHRLALSEYIKNSGARTVADYGSGMGVLSMFLAELDTDREISIFNIEPYPRLAAVEWLSNLPTISWVDSLTNVPLDVIVAQDVLEHVEDPLALAIELCRSVRSGGVAIFANAFHPMIKCHLPATFAYRHTFSLAMRILGCTPQGAVPGAAHALIFEVPEELRETRLRICIPLIRLLGNARHAVTQVAPRPVRNALRSVRRRVGVGLR